MGKAKQLAEYEKGCILALKAVGKTGNEITRRLGRSRWVVQRFLSNPESYGTAKRCGRSPKISKQHVRRLSREASKGILSAREMCNQLELPISVRRTQELLRNNPNLAYVKRKPTPTLTKVHKEARVRFAVQNVDLGEQWSNVVFTDEKKFNLDGPDGYQYYWHDLRKEEQVYSKRQMGGGSVMVWGGFSAAGKTELAVLKGKQKAEDYIQTLTNYYVPFSLQYHPDNCIFQQDNA